MSQIQQSVDVDVPVSVAYNQWTQFESFPQFMDGVESITQVDDTRTPLGDQHRGVEREFDAEITEQHPDERVAWTQHRWRCQACRRGHLPPPQRHLDPGDGPDRLASPRAWPRRSALPSVWTNAGQGGRQAVQGVHRGPGSRDRRLARRRRGRVTT